MIKVIFLASIAIILMISTQVAYMDEVLPPEYNLPWGAKEDISLRTPTSRVYDLPNGQKQLIARRITATNNPMVMGTVTPFDIDAGTDDGFTLAIAVSYPPACIETDDTSPGLAASKSFGAETDFASFNALMRWDTSSIPDADVVTAATLSYSTTGEGTGVQDTDGRDLVGEWYAGSNWPIDCTDHADNVGDDAFDEDLTTVASPIALGTLTGIDKTDYTGLRIGISGGEPVGINLLAVDASESGSDLLLTVTFESACAVSCVLQATGVESGEHLVEVIKDGTTFELYLDGVLEDTLITTGDLVDNSNDWAMFTNNAMPYVEYVTGSQSATLTHWFQFDDLPNLMLEDRSGNGNDAIARYPDTPEGIEVGALPLTDGGDVTIGVTGSASTSSEFIPGIGVLDNSTPGEAGNVPAIETIFDVPKKLMFDAAADSGLPYSAMLIIVAFILTCLIGLLAYAAFRRGFVMYVAMIIGSLFAVFYGDGIWGWIVPVTFAIMCSPFLVKELRS